MNVELFLVGHYVQRSLDILLTKLPQQVRHSLSSAPCRLACLLGCEAIRLQEHRTINDYFIRSESLISLTARLR